MDNKYKDFLNYKALDEKQKTNILAMREKVLECEKVPLKKLAKFGYKIRLYSDNDLYRLEQKLNCTLPSNVKWFLKNIGEGYYPNSYYFTVNPQNNKSIDLTSKDPLDWTLEVVFFGCTFYELLMLKGKYKGMVSFISYDDEYDEYDTIDDDELENMSKDEFENYMADVDAKAIDDKKYFQWVDFIDNYKLVLIRRYKELKGN